jgi:hypothetical protein
MSVAAISPAHAITPRPAEHRPPAVASELPDMPKPVTPATAAGYLMQVPSARVLEALASLQRVMSQQAPAAVERHTDAAQRLAKAVAPVVSGVKVDLEA